MNEIIILFIYGEQLKPDNVTIIQYYVIISNKK